MAVPLKVLIIEDSDSDAALDVRELEKAGYQVTHEIAATAKEMKAALHTRAFDLIISDHNLPQFDTLKALAILKESGLDIPFIVVSGTIGEETAVKIMKAGAHDYVMKGNLSRLGVAVERELREVAVRSEHKKAEEDLKQSNTALDKAMQDTVQAMAVTCETRDPYTAGHQLRVAQLVVTIAEELHLSDKERMGLRTAAFLHDIGKMGIPSEILSKPGKLTTMEYALVKIHVQASYDILKGITFPWPVAQIVYQHHERMDGSGYPNALSGEDIKLEARVLAVADVVEAMTSQRPYRPALGIDKALEEISNNRGKLYDVDIVDACLKLFIEKDFKFE
jgi:putative nucleotidyltransferase with HDIG domain